MDAIDSTRWDQELRLAIMAAGGHRRVAEALGLKRTAILNWLQLTPEGTPARRVPPEYCMQLECLLARPGLACRLRPDIFAPRADLAPLLPNERAA